MRPKLIYGSCTVNLGKKWASNRGPKLKTHFGSDGVGNPKIALSLSPRPIFCANRGGLLQVGPCREASGWSSVFALAVGDGKFWMSDLSTARDSNPKMGLNFRFVLLEIALAKQIPCM